MAGGQSASFEQGSPGVSGTVALSGSAITSGIGLLNVGSDTIQAATGQAMSSAIGSTGSARLILLKSRKVGGGAASFALTGIGTTMAAGVVVKEVSAPLVGSVATLAQGAFSKQRSLALAGSYASVSTGNVTAPTVEISPGLSLVPGIAGYATTNGLSNGPSPRIDRSQMWYESAYTTKDGTIIEHADGAHGTVRLATDLTKDLIGSGNRVGEYDPLTGALTEVYPENREDHGVPSYDNRIYLYFDAIDSLVLFYSGVYSRSTVDTMQTRTWTEPPQLKNITDPYSPDQWTPSKGSTSNTGTSAWTHIQVSGGSAERFPRDRANYPPPAGRPLVYSSSVAANALIYVPSSFAGFEEHVRFYNVHSAYSKQFDCAVIIGGASGSNQVENCRLTIVIPSLYYGSGITPRYTALHSQYSKSTCVVGGARWMLNTGRAACKFLGHYVYWGGGGDQGQSTGTSTTPYVFRADIRPVLANPTADISTTFLPERMANLPWSMNAGAFTADPFTNTILAFAEQGVALYDATTNAWSDVTSSLTEYVATLGAGPYISFPHADFVDFRGSTKLRKTYYWGGWDNITPLGPGYTEKFNKVRTVEVRRGQTVTTLNVETEDPTNSSATIGTGGIGPLRSTKHLAVIENIVPGYYEPADANKRITLFSGDWTDGWPTSQRADYPPNSSWGDDGRQEMWDADISTLQLASGKVRFKLANNFYHNYPWNGSVGYSGQGGFGGVEPQRGPYMPDGLGFVIDKRGQHWMGPCDVGYTGVTGDAAGEQFGAWAPMYQWTKPGTHSNGVRYGNGWTRPTQNRLKRRGAANYGYTTPADWDVGIASDSEAVGWGRPNQSAYDPVNDCIWVVGVSAGNSTLGVALYKFPCVPPHNWVRYPLTTVPLSQLGGPYDSTGHSSTGSTGDGDICNTVWCNGNIYFTHSQQYTVASQSNWQNLNGYTDATTRRVVRIVKVNLNSGSPSSSTLSWVPLPQSASWWMRAYDGPEGGEAASLGFAPLTTSQYRSLKVLKNKLVLGPDPYMKVDRDPWMSIYDTITGTWNCFDPPSSYSFTNGGHDWPISIFNTVPIPSLDEVWLCGKSAMPGTEQPEETWMQSKGMHSPNIYQRSTGLWCGRRIIRFKLGASYSTSFTATENPISEGGQWLNGLANGGSWNNVATSGGNAYGATIVGGYDDCIAISNLSYSANQYAQGTVYRAGGYGTSGSSHEIELLLRFSISSGNAHGYEVLWGRSGELNIVRWNGALGSFQGLLGASGPNIGAAADGDVLRAEISGSTITVYKNGTQVASVSDSTWTTGKPGIGFWPTGTSTPSSYGWKDFTAGNL